MVQGSKSFGYNLGYPKYICPTNIPLLKNSSLSSYFDIMYEIHTFDIKNPQDYYRSVFQENILKKRKNKENSKLKFFHAFDMQSRKNIIYQKPVFGADLLRLIKLNLIPNNLAKDHAYGDSASRQLLYANTTNYDTFNKFFKKSNFNDLNLDYYSFDLGQKGDKLNNKIFEGIYKDRELQNELDRLIELLEQKEKELESEKEQEMKKLSISNIINPSNTIRKLGVNYNNPEYKNSLIINQNKKINSSININNLNLNLSKNKHLKIGHNMPNQTRDQENPDDSNTNISNTEQQQTEGDKNENNDAEINRQCNESELMEIDELKNKDNIHAENPSSDTGEEGVNINLKNTDEDKYMDIEIKIENDKSKTTSSNNIINKETNVNLGKEDADHKINNVNNNNSINININQQNSSTMDHSDFKKDETDKKPQHLTNIASKAKSRILNSLNAKSKNFHHLKNQSKNINSNGFTSNSSNIAYISNTNNNANAYTAAGNPQNDLTSHINSASATDNIGYIDKKAYGHAHPSMHNYKPDPQKLKEIEDLKKRIQQIKKLLKPKHISKVKENFVEMKLDKNNCSDSIRYLNTEAFSEMIFTPQKLLNICEELMTRYKFHIPKLISSGPRMIPSKLSCEVQQTNNRYRMLYNNLNRIPNVQKYFSLFKIISLPDKKLVEYDSGKLMKLARLLKTLKQNKSKALIFTQVNIQS